MGGRGRGELGDCEAGRGRQRRVNGETERLGEGGKVCVFWGEGGGRPEVECGREEKKETANNGRG